MKAKLVRTHTENLAGNIISFWFEPEKPLDYVAGQYTELSLPHEQPDDRGTKRWFTLSSSPSDAPLVSITTKFAQKPSSFKAALRGLKPGDNVHLAEPFGDFVLPVDERIPLVFVAGGIGITPFHSIIKFLYDTKQERDITFLYSVAAEHEMIFQDLFEPYGMKRVLVVDKPQGSWDGETGQLTGQRIVDLTHPVDDALIYISGPGLMVEALKEQLIKLDIDKTRVVGDFFPGYTNI